MAVHIVGDESGAAEIMAVVCAALSPHPVISHPDLPDPDALDASAFIVGVAESDAVASLHRLNRIACARGIPFLPIRITPNRIRLGPTVIPGATACLLCTQLRETAVPTPPTPLPQREGGAREDDVSSSPPPSEGAVLPRGIPPLAGGWGVGNLVAREALRALLGEPSPTRGQLGIFADEAGEWTWHPVLRHPRCPVCGELPWPPISPPSLRGRGAGGGGIFISDETGIVHVVLPAPPRHDEPQPPHVALALLTNTQFRDDWETLPPGERTTIGKGWTAEAARAAAVGEALERYCATLPPPPGTFRVAPRSALDAPAIGPEAFGRYSAAQYADGALPYTPVTDDTSLHWIAGHSLTHDRAVFVPASLVSLLPLDPICQQTSSGLAAGTSYAHAALRGLCEVIERDAFLFTWLTMRPAPLLDLAAVSAPVGRIARHYAARGITLTAHDCTTTGVPVVLAWAHDERGKPPRDLIGLGCDPDPRRAVERAVLEVVQGRRARWDDLAVMGAPETIRTPSDHACWYALTNRSAAFSFLGAHAGPLPARVGHSDDRDEALLTAIVATLARAGREAVIADITTPDVRAAGITVVRALVTGLIPIHFGIGRERLGGTRLDAFPIADLNADPHSLA